MNHHQRKIWSAADELFVELGRIPTQKEVLNQVGGSMGTVNKYMKLWIENRQNADHPEPARELLAAVCRRVYDEISEHVNEERIKLVDNYEAKLHEVQLQVNQRTAEGMRTRSELAEATSANTAITNELTQTKLKLQKIEQRLAAVERHRNELQAIADDRLKSLQSLEKIFKQEQEKTTHIIDTFTKAEEKAISLAIDNQYKTERIGVLEQQLCEVQEELNNMHKVRHRPFSRSRRPPTNRRP